MRGRLQTLRPYADPPRLLPVLLRCVQHVRTRRTVLRLTVGCDFTVPEQAFVFRISYKSLLTFSTVHLFCPSDFIKHSTVT